MSHLFWTFLLLLPRWYQFIFVKIFSQTSTAIICHLIDDLSSCPINHNRFAWSEKIWVLFWKGKHRYLYAKEQFTNTKKNKNLSSLMLFTNNKRFSPHEIPKYTYYTIPIHSDHMCPKKDNKHHISTISFLKVANMACSPYSRNFMKDYTINQLY